MDQTYSWGLEITFARSNCLPLDQIFFFYGDDSWALVCAAFMRGFQTSAPNSAGYQQHVSALFARV
jgi:hypothetical protein